MMVCSGDCFDLGGPPDSILTMPPPPLPPFLQFSQNIVNMSAQCKPTIFCDTPQVTKQEEKLFPGVQYIELPHPAGSSAADETWFMVLVTSCIAVILLGSLLALFLLKCRDESSGTKQSPLPNDLAAPLQSKNRSMVPVGTLYSTGPTPADNRVLWAALTPRGTQHFISDIYPQDCMPSESYPEDNHYESVEAMNFKAGLHEKFPFPVPIHEYEKKINNKSSFDNTGFVDYDYEEPAPLIESYQMDEMQMRYQESDVNPYCIVNQLDVSLGTLKSSEPRPLVSSPTRIENPNLPPLNMYPHRTSTLKKPSHSRRVSDSNSYTGNMNM